MPGFAGIHNTFLHKHLESTLTQSRSSKAKWPAGCLSLQPLFEACPILTGLTSSQVFLERADSQRGECWCSCVLSSLLSIFPDDLSKAVAEKKR